MDPDGVHGSPWCTLRDEFSLGTSHDTSYELWNAPWE